MSAPRTSPHRGGGGTDVASSAASSLETLARAATQAVVDATLHDGGRVGWVTWSRTDAATTALHVAGPEVYDGDAGVAWALSLLAPLHSRPEEALALARAAVAVPARAPGTAGLLDGAAGVALVRAALTGAPAAAPAPGSLTGSADHLDGLSGLLLATVGLRASPRGTAAVGRALLDCGRADGEGWCHPGPPDGHGAAARPLTGLAHGSSGVLLALGHWLATDPAPALARAARERFLRTWLWESAWVDRVLGWPDLRDEPPAYPVLWCHGAAGVTAVRLELGRLADAGVDLGVPTTALRSQADAGLLLCREQVELMAEAARRQLADTGPVSVRVDPHDAGLTLCHGLGGPLDVLASAAADGDTVHLEAAREAVLQVAALLGEDPHLWPTGQRTRGGYGLFQGLSGTALVLARLARPELGLPSPGLFGVPV
ncbi:lanthionine synthetase LanC family protein [uncultured Serinicoccus sp.]|uniref:lanthionine synthetase LanC family protein n=1 Tax=uncultured Serinicoccus sp. TaxID=735514 RepID=UPI0026234120|nr:lanthionine synthetase LanC family protein [uncultured Serinicoccus sp.]